MDWASIGKAWDAMTAPRVPVPQPSAPAPAEEPSGWDAALAKFNKHIDGALRKKSRIPTPIPCESCGGLVWA
jgi:hypothetical protein